MAGSTIERPRERDIRPLLRELRGSRPASDAHALLRAGYAALALIAGADKFTRYLADWDRYLAPIVLQALGAGAGAFMRAVGVVEIAAGCLVALKPRWGGLVVGAWLLGIAANLLLVPAYYDLALRDFALALGAFALARLSAHVES